MTQLARPIKAYSSPFISEATPSMAEALERLASLPDLSDGRRRDLRSAIKSACRLINREPADVPANINWIHIRLRQVEPAAFALSKKRFANIKADVLKAVSLLGCSRERADWLREPSPAWAALLASIPDRHDQWRLSQFAQYCSAKGTDPRNVTDAEVRGVAQVLADETFRKKPEAVATNVVKTWNRLRFSIDGWPDIELAPPPRRRQPWTLPLSKFPESLQAEVENWATGVSNPDPFDPNAPARPLRPASVRVRRFQIQELASALVRQGLPIQDISSFAFLVDVANFKLGLRFLIDRFGGSTEAIHHLAVGIKAIARYHVKVNEPQLREIQGICKRLKVGTNGIREKNRVRLHQLDDPANLGKLLHLPAELTRLSRRPRLRAHRAALLMQAAVAIEILIYAPMRLGNLAALNLERHLRPLNGGKEKKTQILIPGGEVKNKRALHYELAGGSTRLLDLYVRDFRPTLLRSPSLYLFPAQDGGSKRTGALGEIIKSAIRTHTGLIINPHLFRSIAGKIHNLAAPGDFATLSHVIGDSLATAMKSYAQFEQQSSLAHYQRSVDSARAQLVGKVERKRRSQ